jgi:glucose/arabinose dehydrogenase
MKRTQRIVVSALLTAAGATAVIFAHSASAQILSELATNAMRGKATYGDWRSDAPGIRRHIEGSHLPDPYASRSIANSVVVVRRPTDAQLKVPPGFEVKLFASGLDQPRLIRVAPNGDVFVVESSAGRIRLLRSTDGRDEISRNEVFASGLNLPFGIAFYPNGKEPQWIYVANTDSVVRFPYRNGNLRAQDNAETVVPKLPTGGNHWTRDIAFSQDDAKMFVSVGSASNSAETWGAFNAVSPRRWIAALRQWARAILNGAPLDDETERADVLVFDAEGNHRRIYAAGIRNCVGMAVNPTTADLWCSTNERDGLGDDLPPDYITRVREGGFYGWPWYYIGANEDPLHKGARPDLKDKVIVPDVLIQPHSAPLQMVFYSGDQFPAEYHGNFFAASHGSWNREKRTGYKIIRGIVKAGVPTGEYEDFVTGFAIDDAHVWGRPVGIAEAKDGSLLFSEDGNGTIWRVANVGRAPM